MSTAGPFTRLPRPPRITGETERDRFEQQKWFDRIWMILSGAPGISWDIVSKVGSSLDDIETRPHSMLQDVLQSDDTSSSSALEKHVTDEQMKKYEDSRLKFEELNTANGFDTQDEASQGTLAWSNATRIFSIDVSAAETQFHFWANGTKIIKTSIQQVTIPDVTGVYYTYFDNDGVLQYILDGTVPLAAFYEYAIVGIVRWNATQGSGGAGNERHGYRMSGATHLANHETFGALYVSGLGITGLSSGVATYTQTEAGIFRDEDIRHSLDVQATHPWLYRLGADGEWTSVAATNEVGLKEAAATYYQWNEWTGATWQLTEGTPTSDYFITFFIASPSVVSGTGIIKIVGHNSYATVAIAREAIATEIHTLEAEGLPGPEIVFLYAVIVKRDGTLQALADGSLYYDLRGSSSAGVSGASTASGSSKALTATAGNDFVAGAVGYVSSAGTVTLIDADAEASSEGLMVMAFATITGGTSGTFSLIGEVSATAHGFTIGKPLFLSATAGEITETAPSAVGQFVRVVAYALDTNTLYFKGDSTYIEL